MTDLVITWGDGDTEPSVSGQDVTHPYDPAQDGIQQSIKVCRTDDPTKCANVVFTPRQPPRVRADAGDENTPPYVTVDPPDGTTYAIDGATPADVPADGGIPLDGLAPGDHTLSICRKGIDPPLCTDMQITIPEPTNTTPPDVTVDQGDGTNPPVVSVDPPDSLTYAFDGETPVDVPADGKIPLDGLTPGDHTLSVCRKGAQPPVCTDTVITIPDTDPNVGCTDSALAWGFNPSGRLGDGTQTDRHDPTPQVAGNPHFVRIEGGNQGFSYGLTVDGRVWAWGVGGSGQLGNGQLVDSPTPVDSKIPSSVTAVDIAASSNSGAFLTSDGAVYTIGAGGLGQLGTGGTTNRPTWSKVAFPGQPVIKDVEAGFDHMIALSDTGEVYGWGYNGYGNASGTTDPTSPLTPVKVPFPAGTVISDIAAGGYFNVAVDSVGQIWTWGIDDWQQLADGDPDAITTQTPTKITMPADVTAAKAYAGFYNASFITPDGKVYVWGSNVYGSIGQGNTTAANANTPTLVVLDSAAVDMAWGTDSTVALLDNGDVYTWGYGGSGQMGNGTVAAVNPSPLLVPLPNGVTATGVAFSDYAVFASVKCS